MGRKSVVTKMNQAVAGGGGNEDDGDGVLKNQSVKKYPASTTKDGVAEATAEKSKVPVVEKGSLLVGRSTRRSQRLQNVTSSSGDFGIRSELKRVEVVLGSGGGGTGGGLSYNNDLLSSVNLGGGDAGGGVAIPNQATASKTVTKTRGRPRKDTAEGGDGVGSPNQTTASKTTNNDTISSTQVKKTRGRPRKDTAEGGDGVGIPNQTTLSFNTTSNDTNYTVSTDQIKKKRGRPGKDTVEAGVGVAFAGQTTLDFDSTTTSTTNNGNHAISSDQVKRKRGRPRKDTVEGGGRVALPDQPALNSTTTLITNNDNHSISTDLVTKKRGRPTKYTVEGCGDIVSYPTPLCSVPPTPQQTCSSTTPYSLEPPAQQLDTLESGGIESTPHVIAVEAGEAVNNNPSSIGNNGTTEATADLTEKAIEVDVSLRKTKLRRSSKRLQKALSCTQDLGNQSELGHVMVVQQDAEGSGVEAELEGENIDALLKDQSVNENSSSIAKDGNMDVTKELTEVALLENGSGQETKSTKRTQQLPHATSPTRDHIPTELGHLEVVLECTEGSGLEAGQDIPQNSDVEKKDSKEIERVLKVVDEQQIIINELAAGKSFSLEDIVSMTENRLKQKANKYKNRLVDAENKIQDLRQENYELTKKLEGAAAELKGLRELQQENYELTKRLEAANVQLEKNWESVSGAINKLREAFAFSNQTKPPTAKKAKLMKGDKSPLESSSK